MNNSFADVDSKAVVFNKPKPIRPFVPRNQTRIATERVITSCVNTLNSISKIKSSNRRKFVNNYLEKQNKIWQYFWKYLGFKKPTIRMALGKYYKSKKYLNNKQNMSYMSNYCCQILDSAKSSKGNFVLISNSRLYNSGLFRDIENEFQL